MGVGAWVGPPRSYTSGRKMPVKVMAVHHTAGSEGPSSAENGAAYDKTRTDGTSTHAFADSNSVAVEVTDDDRAHHARAHGNEIAIGLELCGTLQTRAQWLDAASLPTLRGGAMFSAEKVAKFGLAIRRLSVAEVRAAYFNSVSSRPAGFAGHADITAAFPEDNGDHTDPGPYFPWDVFLGYVAEETKKLIGGTVDMPKLVKINDGPGGPGSVFRSDGIVRGTFQTWEQALAWAKFWGTATTDLPTIAWADADRLLGPDVNTMKGPKGDPGPATLAPHTHPVSVTGSAGQAQAA